jgi:hypothetical protein
MTASEDRRYDKRFVCEIPIVVSPFNSNEFMEALLVDYCMNGISFISKDALSMGTAIVVKIAYGALKDSHGSDLQYLPSIRIGEVKWCRKHPGETSKAYEVGIKYYHQFY